ncbi:MAG: hypothetical protein WBJ62_11025 [Coriobacteriia bacterium]
MEKPAEEWARAAAELEPLRLEFSIYEQSASRRLALVVVGLVIAPGALMSVIAALDDPAGGAFMAGVFGLLGLTVLGAQRILARDRSEPVTLSGTTMWGRTSPPTIPSERQVIYSVYGTRTSRCAFSTSGLS